MRDPELPPAPEPPELPLLNLLSTSAARRSTTMPLKLEVRLERRGVREERGERADMRREEKVPERWRDAERLVKAVGNGASLRAWVTARPAIDLQLLGGYREEVQ